MRRSSCIVSLDGVSIGHRQETRVPGAPGVSFTGPALVVAFAVFVASSSRAGTSWHFFDDAANLLMRSSQAGGGLDLYLAHPDFQFGPLATAVAAPLALLPDGAGRFGALVLGTFLGAVVVAALERTVIALGIEARRGRGRSALRAGEVAFAVVWTDVAVSTAHLDDAIALAAAAVACAAIAERRPAWVPTLALALSAAAKPWAIAFAPLALVPPGDRRVIRLVVVLGGVVLTWLPFIVDEPGTISAAGSFRIGNAPSSALRALGITDPATPIWVRPVQFGVGTAVALALVRRGRWPAVIMAAVAIRLMIDPGVHHYYAAALVLGVLIWELTVRGGLPVVTVLTGVILEVTPTLLQPSPLAGALRLALTAGLVVAAFMWVGGSRPNPTAGRVRPPR
jgi:hypothetical protein